MRMEYATVIVRKSTKRRQDKARDPHRDDCAKALEVALCLYANGHLATLAWCAAGMPDCGIGPHDIERLQIARLVVQANGGRLKRGDPDRVVELLRQRREAK
jgi:hypothetical protein